jgi:hypothetical protein
MCGVLFLTFVLFSVIGGGALARASEWNVVQLPIGSARSALYGISCPSSSLCVAVGGNDTVAASQDPGGDAATWNLANPGGTFVPPAGGEAVYGGGQIRGISCPSVGFCVAVGLDGKVYSSGDPAGGEGAWKIVSLGGEHEPNLHLFGVSCPTDGFCVGVGYGGTVIVSGEPGGDRRAWSVEELASPFDLRAVSCPSSSFCVAVGNEGEVLVSADPGTGAGGWTLVGSPAGEVNLNAVSCPTSSSCVSAGAGQFLTSSAPAGVWATAAAGSGLPVEGIDCPSESACAAVDDNADVMTSVEPRGGAAAWGWKNVIPAATSGERQLNGMFAISCASTALCVAAGQENQLLVSGDPFEPDTAPVAAGAPGGQDRRLRVTITAHPARRIDPRRGGVGVRFAFRASGAVRGFRCTFAGRGFRPCRSPVAYRTGRGRHVFRVRAVAASPSPPSLPPPPPPPPLPPRPERGLPFPGRQTHRAPAGWLLREDGRRAGSLYRRRLGRLRRPAHDPGGWLATKPSVSCGP